MTIDFLHDAGEERKVVNSVKDFIKIVNSDLPHNNKELNNHCRQYFTPFDYSALLRELGLALD